MLAAISHKPLSLLFADRLLTDSARLVSSYINFDADRVENTVFSSSFIVTGGLLGPEPVCL
jgi:hypothetical protein